MSYCHDIYLEKNFDRAAFAAAARDIRTLIRRSEVQVVGPEGRPNSLPIVEDERIAFSGVNRHCVCGLLNQRTGTCAYPSAGQICGGPTLASRSVLTSGRRRT